MRLIRNDLTLDEKQERRYEETVSLLKGTSHGQDQTAVYCNRHGRRRPQWPLRIERWYCCRRSVGAEGDGRPGKTGNRDAGAPFRRGLCGLFRRRNRLRGELLAQKPDLVILDLGLPDMEGPELLRMIRVRNGNVPIVVLSSHGDEAGKVQALDLGADDYVTKPFGMDELLARMRAALRHQLQSHGERPIFRTGELSVDLVRRIVKVGEKDVKLSPKEYDLLRVLVQHAGKVLTHRFLLKELWDELTDAQYLRVYVRQLRQKIEADPERPQFVLTETGIGYRLKASDWIANPFSDKRSDPDQCF